MMNAKGLWPGLFLIAAAVGFAANDAVRELNLTLGRGELIEFASDVQRVAVSEPKIADAVVVSPKEIMVNAKGVGKASLVVWDGAPAPTRYNVNVLPDLTTLDNLKIQISKSVADTPITVTGNEETLVLTGAVKDTAASKQLESLASTYSKKVVNLLQVPPPTEPRQILLQVKFASIDRVALSEFGFNYFSRNGKMLGGVSTQQFAAPRFSQLQFQNDDFQNSSLNFSDLLNIFLFRPDLNIGSTIKALPWWA